MFVEGRGASWMTTANEQTDRMRSMSVIPTTDIRHYADD